MKSLEHTTFEGSFFVGEFLMKAGFTFADIRAVELEMRFPISQVDGDLILILFSAVLHYQSEGHTGFPLDHTHVVVHDLKMGQETLPDQLLAVLDEMDSARVNGLVDSLPAAFLAREDIDSVDGSSPFVCVVQDGRLWLYSRAHFILERDLARSLYERISAEHSQNVGELEMESGGDPDQNRAIRAATDSGFMILTGGPGTGKTSTAFAMLMSWWNAKARNLGEAIHPFFPQITLAAPTGRAAARLGEKIREQARAWRLRNPGADAWTLKFLERCDAIEPLTLHRLLYFFRSGPSGSFQTDCLVVDEASMVDLSLFRLLFLHCDRNATIFLLGDPDQLPSVNAGSVLRDVIDAFPGASCLHRLRTDHRARMVRPYDLGAPLGPEILVPHPGSGPGAICDDEVFTSKALLQSLSFFARLSRMSTPIEDVADSCLEHCKTILDRIVLAPTHHGEWGIDSINAAIARRMSAERLRFGHPYIVTRNDYSLGVFNGDRGLRIQLGLNDYFLLQEESSVRLIPFGLLSCIEPAWAISVHKSQGSEYTSVVVVLPQDGEEVQNAFSPTLLTRELLYTAITRTKSAFRVYGSQSQVDEIWARQAQRHSLLAHRLRKLLSQT